MIEVMLPCPPVVKWIIIGRCSGLLGIWSSCELALSLDRFDKSEGAMQDRYMKSEWGHCRASNYRHMFAYYYCTITAKDTALGL